MVWQDVSLITKHFPWLRDEFALIGNLRSTFGINIMLYNLALNPHITSLVVWGPDKLSNTPIGIAGKEALLKLWRGTIDDGVLVDQIQPKTLEKILGAVTLIDKSELSSALDIQKFVGQSKPLTKPYMDPVIFPELVVETPDTLPSEHYTYPIRDAKGADAYLTLLHTVWKYGVKTKIDEDSEDVKEIRGATVVVEHEDPSDFYLPEWLLAEKSFDITKNSLEQYAKTQFSDELYRKEIFPGVTVFERPKDYSYLYAELMFAFPRLPIIGESVTEILKHQSYEAARDFLFSHTTLLKKTASQLVSDVEEKISDTTERIKVLLEGLIPPLDQIAYVIDRIRTKPFDLDKEVVLWDQRYHTGLNSGRPCLFKFSFTVRDGKIDVHVFVRSHDIGRAWFFNFYGITQLLGSIAQQTGYKSGMITMESESAHIYKRDWQNVEKCITKQVSDKIPRMYFDPYRDADPRGIVNISVVDKKIIAKLQDTSTGQQLFELEGRSARELLYKLKHFSLISRVDHAAFIGSELAKAEICLKLGIVYKYDNPITLPNNEKVLS